MHADHPGRFRDRNQSGWEFVAPARGTESGHTMTVAMLQMRESRTDALVRLATKARHEGVQPFFDRADGRYYASTPGRLYSVTGYSCECRGFVAHGRCKHHAALLAALGWTEQTAAPEPQAVATTCRSCDGHGTHPPTVAYGRVVRFENVTCSRCHGTGQETAPVAA